MKPKEILSSKLIVICLVVVLAFFANLKYRQWREEQAVDKLKSALQQQADAQQKKGQDLANSMSYFGSSAFKEQVARQQLGLKKNGEIVYNFTAGTAPTATPPAAAGGQSPNPQKWWHYFFE